MLIFISCLIFWCIHWSLWNWGLGKHGKCAYWWPVICKDMPGIISSSNVTSTRCPKRRVKPCIHLNEYERLTVAVITGESFHINIIMAVKHRDLPTPYIPSRFSPVVTTHLWCNRSKPKYITLGDLHMQPPQHGRAFLAVFDNIPSLSSTKS